MQRFTSLNAVASAVAVADDADDVDDDEDDANLVVLSARGHCLSCTVQQPQAGLQATQAALCQPL